MSSKGRGIVVEPNLVEALPPEEKPPSGMLQRIKPMQLHHMEALVWKNFWSLFRNYGYVLEYDKSLKKTLNKQFFTLYRGYFRFFFKTF